MEVIVNSIDNRVSAKEVIIVMSTEVCITYSMGIFSMRKLNYNSEDVKSILLLNY
jgi:hypothetical protein